MSADFLKKDLDSVLNKKDLNEKIIQLLKISNKMEGENANVINSANDEQTNRAAIQKSPENVNEIVLKVKVDQNDVNQNVDFLSNYSQASNELNGNFITLIIDGKEESFKKSFKPGRSGTFLIRLVFKKKLTSCSCMF